MSCLLLNFLICLSSNLEGEMLPKAAMNVEGEGNKNLIRRTLLWGKQRNMVWSFTGAVTFDWRWKMVRL